MNLQVRILPDFAAGLGRGRNGQKLGLGDQSFRHALQGAIGHFGRFGAFFEWLAG